MSETTGNIAVAVPPTPSLKDFTPVSPLERIQIIDMLRGFALFGVLVCNMKGYSLPLFAYFGFGSDWPTLTPLDRGVDEFILFAMKGKFISLFSCLFGLGLSVQLMRAQAKGVSVVPRYMRRLLVLLMFGAAHVLLFWFGDVLHTYALVGFLLLLFRNLTYQTIGRIIAGVWVVILLATFGGSVAKILRPASPAKVAQQKKQQEEGKAKREQEMKDEVRIVTTGTYGEQIRLRAYQWKELYWELGTLAYFTFVLHLFLMGLYAGKRRIFQETEANLPFLRKCMWFGLACGIGGLMRFVPPTPDYPVTEFLRNLLGNAFSNYLFIFYAAGIVILVHHSMQWRMRLSFLAPVGRMALTNYLSHTLIATLLFNGLFLGYYTRIGSAWGLALSCAIYGVQVPLSAWWLSRFQFGPAEWLWRSLTYGKMQPMKVTSLPPQAGAVSA